MAKSQTIRKAAVTFVALLMVVMGAPVTVLAKETDTSVKLLTSEDHRDDVELDGHDWLLNFRWRRRVSPILSWFFAVRYEDQAQQQVRTGNQLFTSRSEQVDPQFEIRINNRAFDFSAGSRWRRGSLNNLSGPGSRNEDGIYGRLVTHSRSWPEFLVEYDRRRDFGSAIGGRTSERISGEVSYRRPNWNASLGARRFFNREDDSRFQQTNRQHLFQLNGRRPFSGGKLTLSGSYNREVSDLENRNPPGQVVTVPRRLLQGLSALDPTPADGLLTDTPSLVDGNRSAPTPANIGGSLAGGRTGWNLGAQLALVEPANLADVWLDTAVPPESAARIQWSVYQSDDGMAWSVVASPAVQEYDFLDGRFRLRFPPVTSRYLKVVNTTADESLGALFVTELEILGEEAAQGQSVTFGNRSDRVSGLMIWAPRDDFSLLLNGFQSRIRGETRGVTTSAITDRSENLTLNYNPSRFLSAVMGLGVSRRSGTSVQDETGRRYSLTLVARPLKDLSLSLVTSRRDLDRSGSIGRTDAWLFRTDALLYEGLSVFAEHTFSAETPLDGAIRNRTIDQVGLDTRPRRELLFTTSLRRETIETPSLPPELRSQRIQEWSNRLGITPSPILSLIVQADYFDTPDRSGWSKIVTLSWLPFPGSALQLFLDYRDETPETTGGSAARSVRLRWNLTRVVFLELSAFRENNRNATSPLASGTRLGALFQGRF